MGVERAQRAARAGTTRAGSGPLRRLRHPHEEPALAYVALPASAPLAMVYTRVLPMPGLLLDADNREAALEQSDLPVEVTSQYQPNKIRSPNSFQSDLECCLLAR